MSFSDWRNWIFTLPWKYKWFVLLILFRPIIDLTWEMKERLLFSPLQVIGLATPLIIIFLLLTKQLKFKIIHGSYIDRYFRWWILLLCLNAFLIWIAEPSLDRLGIAMKITLPAYMYLLLRNFVRSKQNLDGILQTVLFSLIVPAALMLYEIFIYPFAKSQTRGVERIWGGYADVTNYGYYIIFAFFIASYFWLTHKDNEKLKRKYFYQLGIIIGISVLGLFNINHSASYGTFAAVFILFFLYTLRADKKWGVVAGFLILIIGFTVFQHQAHERISILFSGETQVWAGERDLRYAFHGRMGRWERHLGYFTNEISIFEQFFGIIGMMRPYMSTGGTHNDYLRILFTTGYIGILLYMLFIRSVYSLNKKMSMPDRFLIGGILTIILLMSITTNPTYYNHVNYIFISIVSYYVLPAKLKG